jgi:hypothetical protein
MKTKIKIIILVFTVIFFFRIHYAQEGFYNVKKNDVKTNYVFINLKGEYVFPNIISTQNDFQNGVAQVFFKMNQSYLIKNAYGFIDTNGKIIFICRYFTENFSEGYASFTSDEVGFEMDSNGKILEGSRFMKHGYIDKKGNIVIQPEFEFANEFKEGLANVYINGKGWGFINKEGKVVIDPAEHEYNMRKSFFSEGLARVTISSRWAKKPKNGCLYYRYYYGYIDKSGKVVIRGDFSGAGDFSEGLAVIEQGGGALSVLSGGPDRYIDGRKGYINKKGKIVIKPKYASVSSFSEGLVAVRKKKGKWGYINQKGKTVIKFKFDMAKPFYCGLASIKMGNKYGFIDKNGNYVVEPKFEDSLHFSQGYAAVKLNGKWGYINEKGEYLIEPKFKSARTFSEGFAIVELEIK